MSAAPRPRRDPEAAAKIARERVAALRPLCRPASTEHAYLTSHCVSPTATLFEVDRAVACKHLRSHLPSQAGNLTGDVLLVVCMFHLGELASAQLIDAEGRKHFVAGAPTTGAYWCTEDLAGREWDAQLVLVVTEGMAKALAAAMAMPGAIGVAAMSAGNMKGTAEDLRARFPDARIIILGDLGNGEKQARDAAMAVDGDLALPDLDGGHNAKDANDQIKLKGIASLTATLAAASKPEAEAIEAELVTGGDYRFSESEAARRFGDIIRGRALYAADEGVWYYYDGSRWVRDHGGVWLLGESLAVSRAYAEDGIRHGSTDAHFQDRMETARRYNGLPGRKRLIELVKAEPGIAILSSQFDPNPWLFNVLNGTLNLRGGQLQPHSAADLITKLAPVEYDPAATRERWDSFIDEVIPDAEARAHFKRVVGYFLTGEVYEHKLFFCYGTGANGKSVVFEVLLAAWGDYGTLAPVSLLTSKQVEQHPCDLNTLRGRRIALFAETPQGQRWDESRVKALTGGDTITARGMRENYSTFSPTAKFAIAGNYRLRTNDLSEGFRRRFEEMPFEVTIPEERRDPKLAEKLRAELPGVLSWALEGCMAWQRDGLGKSAKVIAATGAYFAENDRIAAFLAERCTFADGNRVSRAALRAAYVEWSEREGEHPINPRDFGEQLRQRGATEGSVRVAGAPVRGWQGVGLLDCGPVVTSKPQENSHVVTRSRQFPDNALEDVSREVIRETASTPGYVTTPADAPDPAAQLAHCLRVRPDTSATDQDKAALEAHFSGLNGTAEAAGERLWTYWKAAPSPTVGEFLARERGGR